MEKDRSSNYYIKTRSKWMRFFDKSQNLTKEILKQDFDNSKVDQIIKESRSEYESLILQLPDIGGVLLPKSETKIMRVFCVQITEVLKLN